MTKAKPKPTIFAYGFDAAGFRAPTELVEKEKCLIRFISFDSEQSLEHADGIVMPSGIFETLKHGDYYGNSVWMECDKDHLAQRQKEVMQNSQRGGWTSFLLRDVNNGSGKWEGSDLAKRYLNHFFHNVECHDPNPNTVCKADEFADYLHDFGISRTTFWGPHENCNPRVLADDGSGGIVAAELLGKFFFLPLPLIKHGHTELVKLVTKCTESVLEFKRRNDLHLPAWVEAVEFQTENKLRDDVVKLQERLIQLEEELSKWRRYKGILSASGKTLNRLVVEIFRDYFKLDVHSEEEFIEDAIIYGGEKPLFVVEIKGVNGGLKREHVNQVDSHRERLEIQPEIPGLLIINDFTEIDGVTERKAKTFDVMHLRLAEHSNIKILRTTTLLEIIRTLETDPDRGQKLIQLCLKGKPMVESPNSRKAPA